ncbi:MAG: hypothetical protein JOY59_09720 [Candidatus Eremiobacteraeota bacterium]|nr:hypothetical protein [Candidatus Eremiobacteraeota bacterium]
MIRGRGNGLEIVFAGRPVAELLPELRARLADGLAFYRSTRATTIFESLPDDAELAAVRAALGEAEILWDGTYGVRELEEKISALGVRYLGTPVQPALAPREKSPRPAPHANLSEAARSLVADFAGARSDLARRRVNGLNGARRHEPGEPSPETEPAPSAAAETSPAVLYHRGTLRGGQSLANVGHIVVVGDVNPGAELLAGGDIVVFGVLRGVAHAGAQGDRSARVYALAFEPTQLRIADAIAAGDDDPQPGRGGPREAFVAGEGGIALAAAGASPQHREVGA